MRVLVTGANGFLGRHVVDALTNRGHSVRALVKPSTACLPPWGAGVDVFRADLRNQHGLDSALLGVEAVVHLAARVRGDESRQMADTLVGTEHLIEAIGASRCRRLVLASSIAVHDWSRARGHLDDASPVLEDPWVRDSYAVTKTWQERIVRDFCAREEVDLTVLRPGFIWGAGNELTFGVGHLAGRLHLVIGIGRRLPLTHVANCADCFACCLEDPRSIGETFLIDDGHDITAWEHAGRCLRAGVVTGRRIPVPYFAGRLASLLTLGASRTLFGAGGKLPSLLTPLHYEARFKPLRFSAEKLARVLGWRPPLDRAAAIEATFGTRNRDRT